MLWSARNRSSIRFVLDSKLGNPESPAAVRRGMPESVANATVEFSVGPPSSTVNKSWRSSVSNESNVS
jgi:hypothetical protein